MRSPTSAFIVSSFRRFTNSPRLSLHSRSYDEVRRIRRSVRPKSLQKRLQNEPARRSTHAKPTKTPPERGFPRADDGTRTHDLLHGKRAVGGVPLPRYPARLSRKRRSARSADPPRISRVSSEFRGVWAASVACCPKRKRTGSIVESHCFRMSLARVWRAAFDG